MKTKVFIALLMHAIIYPMEKQTHELIKRIEIKDEERLGKMYENIIAYSDTEQPLGHILLLKNRQGHINNIAVNPYHHQKGIATALLKHLVAVARERNYSFLSGYVPDSQEWMIKFLQKKGALINYGKEEKQEKKNVVGEKKYVFMTYFLDQYEDLEHVAQNLKLMEESHSSTNTITPEPSEEKSTDFNLQLMNDVQTALLKTLQSSPSEKKQKSENSRRPKKKSKNQKKK